MQPNNKIGLGIIGEMFVYSVLKSIFKAKEGYRVAHVNWNHYNYGYGLDVKVYKQHGIKERQVLGIEVKNWKNFDKPYGTQITRTEIIQRFLDNPSSCLKLLVITFASLLPKRAKKLLHAHGIGIIEVGKLIGKGDFPRKHHYSQVFYSLKAKIERVFKERAKSVFCGVSCGSANTVSQLLLQYNTRLEQHDTDTYKQANNSPNPLAVYILNRLKGKTRFKEKIIRSS